MQSSSVELHISYPEPDLIVLIEKADGEKDSRGTLVSLDCEGTAHPKVLEGVPHVFSKTSASTIDRQLFLHLSEAWGPPQFQEKRFLSE